MHVSGYDAVKLAEDYDTPLFVFSESRIRQSLVETNSGGELFKALRVGFQPGQIIFNGTSGNCSRTTVARCRLQF